MQTRRNLPNWRKAAAATYDRLAVLALSDEEQAKWLRRKREMTQLPNS